MKLRVVVLGIAFLGFHGVSAWAIPLSFSNTIDFDTPLPVGPDHLSRTAIELLGNINPSFVFNYSHTVPFSPPAASIFAATLTLTHSENSNNPPGELWFLSGGTSITSLGNLAFSNSAWVDQTFTIPTTLYPTFLAGSWTLQLRLTENTAGTDRLWLDQSVLAGTYDDGTAAVPEPGTLVLLGLGLTGLALRRRR